MGWILFTLRRLSLSTRQLTLPATSVGKSSGEYPLSRNTRSYPIHLEFLSQENDLILTNSHTAKSGKIKTRIFFYESIRPKC
ncbi:MAG: hypothetical protein RBG13Loki_2685 [Promethearchaeota archaeon CR_4]|nr:MAG: hypothetical protein RBG13Loki_2685 [Candidatus Lokiarchaeota archaeon CR_4]